MDWAALPDSGPALANLDRLLRGLRAVIGEVCADEMGRRAWARVSAMTVAHRSGMPLSITRHRMGLAVLADLIAALPRDRPGQLCRQVNELL